MVDKTYECLNNIKIDNKIPTVLYSKNDHHIYWLGTREKTLFRTNIYLVKDHDRVIIVDPGARQIFPEIKARVEQIVPVAEITDIIACHQDPDVVSAMMDFLEIQPEIKIWTSSRAYVLILHYGPAKWVFMDINTETSMKLPSSSELRFITAPFLHSPAAFATYDTASGYLFSGDIWASLVEGNGINFTDFESHKAKMDLFNRDYMASNLAARGFVKKISDLKINGILPQHGLIIPKNSVQNALEYIRNLRCGTDIIYADLAKK
jgi:flavorubredoxin